MDAQKETKKALRDVCNRRFGKASRLHATHPYPLCRCATSPPDRGSRPPRPPIYEGHPFGTAVTFRRLEICVHGSVLSGPTGALGGCKIVCIAVPRLRLGFRSQRSGGFFLSPVDRRRGGTLGRPPFTPSRSRWVSGAGRRTPRNILGRTRAYPPPQTPHKNQGHTRACSLG